MNMLKRVSLYLFGIGLILFGNRTVASDLFLNTDKTDAKESPFGSLNTSEKQNSDVQSGTVIEPATTEDATATQ